MGDQNVTGAAPSCGEDEAADACVRKLGEVIAMWQQAGVPYEQVVRWIDRHYVAARAADRFRREQPHLAAAIAQAKSLDSDAELQVYLEEWVRKWDTGESDAYRQLILLGHGFVAAPSDPSAFGLWFRVVHQDRWKVIREQTSLADDEIFDFIRHVIEDDGLSPIDLYERMIEMSHQGVNGQAADASDAASDRVDR